MLKKSCAKVEQANVPVGSIQRILGHESRTTTEIYLHSIGDSERAAMDVLNESFGEFPHTKPTQMEKGYSSIAITP